MRYSIISAIALGATFVSAHPIEQRSNFDAPPGGDITILNYALTLEYLERKFYEEAVKKFSRDDFVGAGFYDPAYDNLKTIYADEKSHVESLVKALGDAAVKEATYKFPFTDVKSFLALSAVIEDTGVGAYVGAAAAIADNALVTIAGSYVTVEARHTAYVRQLLKQKPFPKAYDTPLNFNQVFSIAAQFITGFAPGADPLPFKPFPPLAITAPFIPDPTDPTYTVGSSVVFADAKTNAIKAGLIKSDTPVFAVLFSGLDKYYVPVSEGSSGDFKFANIPEGAAGQVYIVLSTSGTAVSDENTISGVGIIEVSPKKWCGAVLCASLSI